MDELVMWIVLKTAEELFGIDRRNFKILELKETSYGFSCHLCLATSLEFKADDEAVQVYPHIAFVKLYPRKNTVRLVFNFSYARFRDFFGKLGKYEFSLSLPPDIAHILQKGRKR
jgi:hypothetical protein